MCKASNFCGSDCHAGFAAHRKALCCARTVRLNNTACFAGFSDHDLLFTRPGEQGGSGATTSPADPTTAQSAAGAPFQSRQQARPPAAVAPARRRAAGVFTVVKVNDVG